MKLGIKRLLVLGLVGTLFATAACASHNDYYGPYDTEIEFGEVMNLGYACGGPLTSWTVSCRETGDTGTAGCEQPVLFQNLAPNATYTFDIQGFDGNSLCWQGACTVDTRGGELTVADCHTAIEHLCNE